MGNTPIPEKSILETIFHGNVNSGKVIGSRAAIEKDHKGSMVHIICFSIFP